MSKYRKLGAYHWREYNMDDTYRHHVDFVCGWIDGDCHTILDVGAGDGLITHKLRSVGFDAVGIDSDPYAVELAMQHSSPVALGTAENPPAGPYDAVYLGDVIEHVENPSLVVGVLANVTNRLYVVTPPPTILDKYARQQFTAADLAGLLASHGWQSVLTQATPDRLYVEAWR